MVGLPGSGANTAHVAAWLERITALWLHANLRRAASRPEQAAAEERKDETKEKINVETTVYREIIGWNANGIGVEARSTGSILIDAEEEQRRDVRAAEAQSRQKRRKRRQRPKEPRNDARGARPMSPASYHYDYP